MQEMSSSDGSQSPTRMERKTFRLGSPKLLSDLRRSIKNLATRSRLKCYFQKTVQFSRGYMFFL